jgi:phosphatidylglycerophosphate synthase
MSYKDLYEQSVSSDKRAADKKNIWLFWVVRPISILMTMPLMKTKITPTSVTIISVVSSVIGFFVMTIMHDSMLWKIVGWSFFFFWAVLDCVDGNLARAKNQCSSKGELWDAIGGYSTMVLMYFAAGIVSFFDNNLISFSDNYWLLIAGGATSVMSIFPRLILHKKEGIEKAGNEAINRLVDKKNFSLPKVLLMNFISVIGLFQVLFLVCIITHTLNWFIAFYFFVNLGMMLLSIRTMVK